MILKKPLILGAVYSFDAFYIYNELNNRIIQSSHNETTSIKDCKIFNDRSKKYGHGDEYRYILKNEVTVK